MAITEEFGSVLITQSPGKAEKWAALQEWIGKGGSIEPFAAQTPEKQRDPLAELDELKAALIAKNVISESDASLASAAEGSGK